MCGICGRFNRNKAVEVKESLVEQMCSKIIHRGPDDTGVYTHDNFGFGMRRLSIIDLSTGHQPIFNEDKSLVIVFNGEIYNYIELKEELEKRGHVFSTNSDTETILHAYEEYGEEFVTKLNGMFAIAIFNIKTKELLVYRDRIGIKPLFYYLDEDKFIFGSEIKTILTNPDIKAELDPEGLDLYLSFGYITDPKTIFKGIHKLKPGHYIKLNAEGLSTHKYWTVDFSKKSKKSEKELKKDFVELFDDAVKIRMQSEVPFGAFLSGGIDSSLIVAMMANHAEKPLRTFSLGYSDDQYYNETQFAEVVSKKYNTSHKSFLVDSKILTDYLDLYIDHFDEPFADYSAFPTYVVSKKAKEHVTVVLSGDGGDEIFSGYKRYYAELLASYTLRIPKLVRNGIIKPFFSFLSNILPSSRRRDYIDFLIKKFEMLDLNEAERYYVSSSHNYFTYKDKEALYQKDSFLTPDYSFEAFKTYWDDTITQDFLGKRQFYDIHTKLPGDMLTKVDRMSMATSLEVRVPFLDHRVVEFAATLPSSMRMNVFKMKRFLKNASVDYLPKDILKRKKHGFSSPIDKWFREDLLELARETFSAKSGLSEYINFDYINELLDLHVKRKANYGNKLFTVLVLQLWYNKYIND